MVIEFQKGELMMKVFYFLLFLYVCLGVILGFLIKNHLKPKSNMDRYDSSMYSQTFNYLDKVNIEQPFPYLQFEDMVLIPKCCRLGNLFYIPTEEYHKIKKREGSKEGRE